jgi:hypothetical protein
MYMLDRRMDAELHIRIHQVEFLATLEFSGLEWPWLTF